MKHNHFSCFFDSDWTVKKGFLHQRKAPITYNYADEDKTTLTDSLRLGIYVFEIRVFRERIEISLKVEELGPHINLIDEFHNINDITLEDAKDKCLTVFKEHVFERITLLERGIEEPNYHKEDEDEDDFHSSNVGRLLSLQY